MYNIQNHVIERGDETLETRPFDALDSMALTQIVYMPFEGLLDRGETCTIAEAWAFLKERYPDAFADIFQRKRYEFTGVCAAQPRYRDWVIRDYINLIDTRREMQFAAATFDTPAGVSHITFRGTDLTLVGWKEDLNMSFMTVPSQREAVEYVDRVAAGTGDALYLGGHSKGGNLSIYASVYAGPVAQERIRRVYCFDGPGLDAGTIKSDAYFRVRERIESYIPQSSVVGMLLHYHARYTVVRSLSPGLLQHDTFQWQIRDGAFETLPELNAGARATDETLHEWLEQMDDDKRRFLVDTLYSVIDASHQETITGIIEDWRDSAARMLAAARGLDPETRKNVGRILGALFSAQATETLRSILPHALRQHLPGPLGEADG